MFKRFVRRSKKPTCVFSFRASAERGHSRLLKADCSAARAKGQEESPETHRAFQSPQWHSTSRSDNSGTWPANGERYVCGKNELLKEKVFSFLTLRNIKLLQHGEHNRLKLGAFFELCPCSCNKNKIPVVFDAAGIENILKSGSDNPTGAVAFNGTADFFARCYANAAKTRAVFHRIDNQHRFLHRLSFVIKAFKVLVLIERNILLQKNQIPTQIAPLGAVTKQLPKSIGELLAAL